MSQHDRDQFLPYPIIMREARLSTSSTFSNSSANRTSCSSFNNEIDDNDDSVSSAAISLIEEKLYVALGVDSKEGERILSWAMKNSGGKAICIVHVHQLALMIPFMGGKLPAAQMKEQVVRAYRENELQNMHKLLNEYLLICKRGGVQAEKLHIETTDCIEKGIVNIISQYGMKTLVMGAAASKHYSRKMTALKSKKAIYVNTEAPTTCHIWFVCKGQLIYTREGSSGVTHAEAIPEVQQPGPSYGTKRSDPIMARSVTLGPNTERNHISPSQNHLRAMSLINLHGKTVQEIYNDSGASTPNSARHSEASLEEQEGASMRHYSQASHLSTCSSSNVDSWVASAPCESTEVTWESQDEIEMHLSLPLSNDVFNQVLPPSILDESADHTQLYNELEQALEDATNSCRESYEKSVRHEKAKKDAFDAILRARASERVVHTEVLKKITELEAALQRKSLDLEQAKAEAENLKREAIEESMRRGKAEEEAVDASRRVKESEEAYAEELKQTKELKAAFLRERLEGEKIQNHRDTDKEELQRAYDQRSQLERRIAQSVGLFTKYKKERDELQIKLDNALQLVDDLKRKQAKSSNTAFSKLFSEFSFLEIEEATHSFHPSLKIREGDYGTIYKGILRHTEVTIKMLHTESLQGPPEYQIEVDILSKLRHPNLVTLIGACPDFWTLIFDYQPNGTLEDRLYCKENSSPLSWQTRIRIATELSSALVFLHSSTPHSIVHGDVKPANILLDANFVSKLGNFRAILPNDMESTKATTSYRSDIQDETYMDLEISSSGQPTTKTDVYSFGVVLLQLITGKQEVGIAMEVQNALDKGELKSILDYTAGDWPYVHAVELAHLGLRCVGISKERPDLGSEVWSVLKAMQVSFEVSSSSVVLDSEDSCQAPHYFICPISQDVMRDPHMAADGFTYEADSLKGWFDGGHDTSPMTNLKLTNTNLVPNLALRSAIQEWQLEQKE